MVKAVNKREQKPKVIRPVVGGLYRTRDGSRVEIVAKLRGTTEYPFVGVLRRPRTDIQNGLHDKTVDITKNGRYFADSGTEHEYDFVKRIK